MRFSIVIPAYNEQEHISATIASILAQDTDRSSYEIIVADNGSQDETARAAREAGADLVVSETEKKGPNAARQRGFIASRGSIIAFLDADCRVPRDWLERIGRAFDDPGLCAISGPYEYGFSGMQKKIDDVYERFFLPRVPGLLKAVFRKKAGVIIGGNFAARRNALERIGGIPYVPFWGDDATIAMRISRTVGTVLFDPDLRIKSSPRRFQKERLGFVRLPLRYARAFLRAYFADKQ
jgi:glycosyltransferase involved in cell wall biosynthesis